METVLACDESAMSLTAPIKWDIITMCARDMEKLQRRVLECLKASNSFVWLYASPDQGGITQILDLRMADQLDVEGAQTVCTLDMRDARFRVGSWIFQAIHNQVTSGALCAQAVSNRKTMLNGWIVISPDPNQTLQDQYGSEQEIRDKFRKVQLGDDKQASERLQDLELERLEQYLDDANARLFLVPGAKVQDKSFVFTDITFPGDPAVDINELTRSLASRTDEHMEAVILHAFNQGKKVIQVIDGVLQIRQAHAMASWCQICTMERESEHPKTSGSSRWDGPRSGKQGEASRRIKLHGSAGVEADVGYQEEKR
jgi:hypothetical protein